MHAFGYALKELREEVGISATKAADRSKIDRSYWSKLENGNRNPPTKPVVLSIARALDCSSGERDRLLMLAGHLPLSAKSILSEPLLSDLDDALSQLPDGEDKRDIQVLIRIAIDQSRLALTQ